MKLRRLLILPLLAALLLGLPAFSQDNPDASCCTTTQAQANVLAAAQAMAVSRNGNLATIYAGAVSNWLLNAYAHPNLYPASTEPQPPKSFIVVADSDGWATVAQTGSAVAAVPPIPADLLKLITPAVPPPPSNIDIGHPVDSNGNGGWNCVWFSVGDNDSFPLGKQTPPLELPAPCDDGSLHVMLRYGYIFGRGYYEKVN